MLHEGISYRWTCFAGLHVLSGYVLLKDLI